MLKTFIQPGSSATSKTESARAGHSGYASARTPEPAREEAAPAPAHHDEGTKLIVGPNIKLKGAEITDCEILVVEGRVEASMNSRDIRIAEGGVFSGKAEIDVAEVRGTFEGELTARKRLVVYATGRVNGTIRYGALMVEEGGTIVGNVALHSAAPGLSTVPDAPAHPAASAPGEEKPAEPEQAHSGSPFVHTRRRQA